MALVLLTKPATAVEVQIMSESLGTYIKFAVDVQRAIAAGGGELHADCEAFLLRHGSKQDDVWAAHIDVETGEIGCESMVNLRPKAGNFSLEIQNHELRDRVVGLIRHLMGQPPIARE